MAPAGTTVAIKPRACTVNAAVLVAPTDHEAEAEPG
jgi:hypothetical protein